MVRRELPSCRRLCLSNICVLKYAYIRTSTTHFGSICTRCLAGLSRTVPSQFLLMRCLFPYEEPHGISAQARFMRRYNKQGQLLCTCCARSRLKGLVVVFALVCVFVCEGLHVSEAGFAGQHTFSISGRVSGKPNRACCMEENKKKGAGSSSLVICFAGS